MTHTGTPAPKGRSLMAVLAEVDDGPEATVERLLGQAFPHARIHRDHEFMSGRIRYKIEIPMPDGSLYGFDHVIAQSILMSANIDPRHLTDHFVKTLRTQVQAIEVGHPEGGVDGDEDDDFVEWSVPDSIPVLR